MRHRRSFRKEFQRARRGLSIWKSSNRFKLRGQSISSFLDTLPPTKTVCETRDSAAGPPEMMQQPCTGRFLHRQSFPVDSMSESRTRIRSSAHVRRKQLVEVRGWFVAQSAVPACPSPMRRGEYAQLSVARAEGSAYDRRATSRSALPHQLARG